MQLPFDPQQPPTGANGQPPFPPQGPYPQGPYPPGQYSQQGQYPGGPGAYYQQNQQAYPGQAWPGTSPMAARKQSIDIGRTFATTFRVYKESLGKFLGISGVAALLLTVVVIASLIVFFSYLVITVMGSLSFYYDPAAGIMSMAGSAAVFTIVLWVLSALFWCVGSIGSAAQADATLTTQGLSIGQAISIGFKKALAALPVIIAIGLGMGALMWAFFAGLASALGSGPISSSNSSQYAAAVLGFLGLLIVFVLVFVVVEYIVIVKCFLTFPIMVAEGLGVWAAAKRSWSMTKGTAGMIFLLIFLASLLIGVASQVISVPVTLFMPGFEAGIASAKTPADIIAAASGLYIGAGILSFIVSLFTMPIFPIMMSVVYRDRLALETSNSR